MLSQSRLERIYWLGRYLERTENTAACDCVIQNLLLICPEGAKVDGNGRLVEITGTTKRRISSKPNQILMQPLGPIRFFIVRGQK